MAEERQFHWLRRGCCVPLTWLVSLCGPDEEGKATLLRLLQAERPDWTVVPRAVPLVESSCRANPEDRTAQAQLRVLQDRLAVYAEVAGSCIPVALLDGIPWEDAEIVAPHVLREAKASCREQRYFRKEARRLLARYRDPDLVVIVSKPTTKGIRRKDHGYSQGCIDRLIQRYRAWPQKNNWIVVFGRDTKLTAPRILRAVEEVMANP